jgi:hypothetical protein
MTKRAFPRIIHVVWEDQANDDPYLAVHDSVHSVAEAGEVKRVALYKLVEVGNVVAPPQYLPPKRSNPK